MTRPIASRLRWSMVPCALSALLPTGTAWACDGCPCGPEAPSHASSTHHTRMAHTQRGTGLLGIGSPGPSNRSTPPLRFVMVGDTQGGAVAPQIVADIARVNPAYVLFTGDLVSPGRVDTYNAWNNMTAQFGDNRFMVPGNHDLPGRPATNGDWQSAFHWLPDSQAVPNIMTADPDDTVTGVDQMDYYVDLTPNVRLISVTSDRDLLPGESPTYTGYEIVGGEPQALEWFQSVMALESTRAMNHVFVMTHHPVTTMMSQVNSSIDGLTEGVGTEWWRSIAGTSDAFEGATAAALLAGHNHSYIPNHPDPHSPTAEIIAGTGGGSLEYGGVPHRKVHGFVEIVVENGLISSTFYGDSNGAADGWSFTEVLDTFTISEHGMIPRGELARYRFEANAPASDSSLSPLSKSIDLNLRDGVQHVFDHDRGSNVALLDGTAYMDSKSLSDHNFQVLGDLRIDLWARAEGALGGEEDDNTLVAFGDADGNRPFPWQDTINDEIANYAYILSYTEDGHLRMAWEYHASTDADARPTRVEVVSTLAVDDPNAWHHIEVLRDAETMSLRFLVDGMPLGEDLVFGHLPTGSGTGSLYIGAMPDIRVIEENGTLVAVDGGIATFRGRIDDLIISSELVTLFSLGDANQDGAVGVEDLDILLANWGDDVTPGNHMLGDLNGDGAVGQADLAYVLTYWSEGAAPGGQAPEPTTLGALAFPAMLLVSKRQRRPSRRP